MLRLSISDDDAVLVCMPVHGRAVRLMPGTIVVQCQECDRDVWKAPGIPVVRWSNGGLVPNYLRVQPNVILCIPCAGMHRLSSR